MSEETLVVVSKVKDYIKTKGCQTSGDAIPALSDEVKKLIDKAVERVHANGRQTVKPQDL
jgi:histone H3/H4